jgi:hypothetical protein
MEKYSYSIFAYHFVIDNFVLVEIFWILMDSKIENYIKMGKSGD